MADRISLQKKIPSLEASPQQPPYSKVIIHINDDDAIVVGDDSGAVMEYTDPLGTREQAERQLQRLRAAAYQYQPFKADEALLDPSAEFGDGVSANSIYGGIYSRAKIFNRLMRSNVSAPHGEEINKEFKYTSPADRKYKRDMYDVRASLRITSEAITAEVEARTAQGEQLQSTLEQHATDIAAKVSQEGGNSSNSFSWQLKASGFYLYANGHKEVFKATESGVEVKGKITAEQGYIGTASEGFTIKASAIYNNIETFSTTNKSYGIYLGTDGIRLGKNFYVDDYGNMTCKNATINGTLTVGRSTITADELREGASNGYDWYNGGYGGATSRASYALTGGGYGYGYNNATKYNNGEYPNYFKVNNSIGVGRYWFSPVSLSSLMSDSGATVLGIFST